MKKGGSAPKGEKIMIQNKVKNQYFNTDYLKFNGWYAIKEGGA